MVQRRGAGKNRHDLLADLVALTIRNFFQFTPQSSNFLFKFESFCYIKDVSAHHADKKRYQNQQIYSARHSNAQIGKFCWLIIFNCKYYQQSENYYKTYGINKRFQETLY